MRTLLPDPPPVEFERLLERRRLWGADRHDEVWEGVLHMNPMAHGRHARIQAQLLALLAPVGSQAGLTVLADFNLGERDDYRIPDGGLHRPGPDELYYPTAALVIEVLSPGDETWNKLAFYAPHHVDELLIVDPDAQSVAWLGRSGDGYDPIARSSLIALGPGELSERLDWPAGEPST
jgi:Uma2 family endonuclease